MYKNKFLWLPLSMLLLFAMVLSACAGQANTKAPAPTQAPVTTEAPTEAMASTIAPPAAAGGIDCMGAQSGDTLSLLYQWSETDQEKFNKILKPLVDKCGIVLKPESTPDQAQLDTLVKAVTPPDIVFGNVAQLTQYKDLLKPMTDLGVHPENYADYWKEIGTLDGNWLGLPVDVDIKTIMWYSPANFQKFGYQVPTTLSDFQSMIEKMASNGNPPWSMGFESGDTTGRIGADVIEDILLAEQGAAYVNHIIDGTHLYNDSGVWNAYYVYGNWAKDDHYTAGGAQGTLSTNINDAVYKVFADPPEAMMVRQSGQAGDVIASQYPNLKFGTGYDFFQEPLARGQLHGGSEWMMAFSDSAAVKALVAYLSSNQGGQMWAQVGFENTPNMAGTNFYQDEGLKKQAQILANAKVFVPDIEDAIPGGFASAERQAIVDFINGASLSTLLNNVAAVQKQALGK